MPDEKRERFNLETMSGIFPGTRTQVFQRIIVECDAPGETGDLIPNAQVAWYDDPAACVVVRDGESDALVRVEREQNDAAGRATFWAELVDGLEKRACPLRVCGTCSHWRETAAVTADGLAFGACVLGHEAGVDDEQAGHSLHQSVLALACSHWHKKEALIAPSNPVDDESTKTGATHEIDDAARIVAERVDASTQPDDTFFQEKAKGEVERVSDGERGGIFERLKKLFGQNPPPPKPSPQPLTERSGVGAGTESCFACQGRIANLGALVTQTDEGDSQTFSVWRCRVCSTYYLNRWVDRWERLDNLETEEVYYRLAPSEALMLLQEIDAGNGSAEKFMGLLAERGPLSHQIKHGR